MRRAFSLVLAAFTAVVAPGVAGAAGATTEHVSGVVLVAEPGDKILMHHDATGVMPAMTMEFALPPGTRVRAGDRISGTADTAKEPWLIGDVHVAHLRPVFIRSATMAKPLQVGDTVPSARFVSASGRAFDPNDLRGHPYALTFVYTRCRDARMCPLVSSKFVQLSRLTPSNVRFVEITLDPEHDRPAVLASYAKLFAMDPSRFTLAAASPIETARFAAAFGILARRTDATTIVHSERLAIVGPNGRIRALIDNALWNPHDVARELGTLG